MTVFLPIAARLDCGSTITVPKGRWEETSSRFISIYKSDWKRFNGKPLRALGGKAISERSVGVSIVWLLLGGWSALVGWFGFVINWHLGRWVGGWLVDVLAVWRLVDWWLGGCVRAGRLFG